MKNFQPFYFQLAKAILDPILKNGYIGGTYQLDSDKFFIDTVESEARVKVTVVKRRLNNNFPQLLSTSFSVFNRCFNVSANSSDLYTERGKKLSGLKARGEFLERLSAYLPLDILKKNDFDLDKTIKTLPKSLPAKKLFSYGSQKVHPARVFYSLRNNFSKNTQGLNYQPTTNGGAGHFIYKQAVLNGLLELIQRDAFLMYWMNSISPKKIDANKYLEENGLNNDTVINDLRLLLNDFKKYNLTCHFLDITSDIAVPAVCCVLISDSPEGEKVALGASAGFNPCSNLLSSATEATSVFSSNYFKEAFVLDDKHIPFQDKKIGRNERLRLYMNSENYKHFDFFVKNEKTISVEDWASLQGVAPAQYLGDNVQSNLSYLKKLFNARKKTNSAYEVLIYKIQNKLLEKFDYIVVRVLCDALYSLYLNERFADPKHPRLAEFIKNKNLESEAKLNIWPHPFP
jgi:thiazole/oxazole-forming peptide maturase SagD family component